MKTKTFVVLVEDDLTKVVNVKQFLDKKGIKHGWLSAVNPTLRFITENHERIDGIILDLGLPIFNDTVTNPLAGLRVVKELKRLGINIPVLINSSTSVENLNEEYPFVFKEQRKSLADEQILNDFLESL